MLLNGGRLCDGLGTYGGGSDQPEWGQGIYGFNWWFNAPMEPNGPLAWPDAPEYLFMATGIRSCVWSFPAGES